MCGPVRVTARWVPKLTVRSCVSKFFSVNQKVGEQMQALGQAASAGGGAGGAGGRMFG